MRIRHLTLLVCVFHTVIGAGLVLAGQAGDAALTQRLKQLFPRAATFSPKEGTPPHYKAFAGDAGRSVVGYAFWTVDLEPLDRGYDGPIQMLVGLDPQGLLTGVVVTAHREPYGYFSIDKPEFAKQFVGKDVRTAFKVGADVEAVSRATITMNSAARSIRNGARKIARAFLTPPDPSR